MLARLPERLRHIRAVAEKSADMAEELGADVETAACAGWLHDIGYAPDLRRTGFHSLDGAVWLAERGELRLAGLVAHHSSSISEAKARGLAARIAAFPDERSLVSDILCYADLTTGPTGADMTFDARLADVGRRYDPEHPVVVGLRLAEPELRPVFQRVESLLDAVRSADERLSPVI